MNTHAVEDILPLTPAQLGLLFETLSAPQAGVYVLQATAHVRGRLDPSVFQLACREVVRRHSALRASFHWQETERALQVIHTEVDLPIHQVDWTGLEGHEERLAAFLAADRAAAFDLSRAPLMRLHLIRRAPDRWYFVWTSHHIVVDGWSVFRLLPELWRCYSAMQRGDPPPAPHTSRRYSDFTAWLQQCDTASAERYWRRVFDGFASAAPMPPLAGAPASPSEERGIQVRAWSAAATRRLRHHAQRSRLTLATLVHGAMALLLSRYGGGDDVVFGTVTSGRPPALTGVEQMIGLFLNTLPLRVRLAPAMTVRAWLQEIQRQLLEVREYEYCALGDVRTWAGLPRDSAVFDSLVAFENYPIGREAFRAAGSGDGALAVTDFRMTQVGHYPLSLIASDRPQLTLQLQYDGTRFDRAAIGDWLDQYERLLEELAAGPDRSIGALSLPTATQRRRIVETWNATAAAVQPLCLHEIVEARAAGAPDAVAVESDGLQLSYGALNRRANQLAGYLRERGIGPDARVALCVERSLELVVGMFGILKAGAVYVPLDPTYPPERLASVFADARVAHVLTVSSLLPQLPASGAAVTSLDRDWPEIARHAPVSQGRTASLDHLAYLIYTSGSTGAPKGVMISHRSLSNMAQSHHAALGIDSRAAVLGVFSPGFDGTIWQTAAPLSAGARVSLPARAPVGPEVTATVRARGITVLALPASVLANLDAGGLPQIRLAISVGEACPVALVERWASPGRRVINCYGPAEATVAATIAECQPHPGPVPIGAPLPNTTVFVVDREAQLAPAGLAGELHIGGAGVGCGYLNRPALTAERFTPDPCAAVPGARVYRTGDLARWRRDGQLEFVGRIDGQVKIRGFRVEPREIEAALERHPEVRAAVVVADAGTTGEKRLVAYIVPAPAAAPTTSGLRAHLERTLPEYMVPALFVTIPALPLTSHGKVDRRALPPPPGDRPTLGNGYVPPRTETERQLAAVWQQVLGVDRVGVTDNFFEIGGDSILAIQIVARAAAAGVRLLPRQLFDRQTIAALAPVVTAAADATVEQATVTGTAPLTPIQRWFFAQEFEDPDHFNQALWLTADAPIDAGALAVALRSVLAHHDALRLRFRARETWRQEHSTDVEAPIALIHPAAASAAEHEALLARTAAGLQAQLSLRDGPLVRVALCSGGPAPDRVFIVVHHLVIDIVSWGILIEDLGTAYGQARGGHAVTLPRKTTSFKTWAERLQAYAASPALLQEAPYWDAVEQARTTPLPVDCRDGDNVVGSARTVTVSLTAAETAVLLQDVPQAHGRRVHDLLLTALGRALTAWTGDAKVRVMVETHGREPLFDDVDLSRTVGWLTAMHPLVLDLTGAAEPGEALRAVQEQLRRVPRNGIGYGVLRYGAREPGALAAACEISFNYLGRLDAADATRRPFRVLAAPTGPDRSLRQRRPALLEVNAAVQRGEFSAIWTYSVHRHHAETIGAVAGRFLAELRTVIAHCLAPGAGGYTASDFGDVPLSQSELEFLINDTAH